MCVKPHVTHFLRGSGRSYYPFQQCMKLYVHRHIRKLYIVLCEYQRFEKSEQRPVYAREVCVCVHVDVQRRGDACDAFACVLILIVFVRVCMCVCVCVCVLFTSSHTDI